MESNKQDLSKIDEPLEDETTRRALTISAFQADLAKLINYHSMESLAGDTPDFILANHLTQALLEFGRTMAQRDKYFEVKKPWETASG